MKSKLDLLEHRMKGTVKGIDNHFEIKDSDYLNITLDSSEEIELCIESIPEMITLDIKESNKADSLTSTEITLSGLNPNTTYHKYEDNYHNHVPFTTDESGKYVYTQDISESHIIFIQPRSSTYFLKETGWEDSGGTTLPSSIATWDPDPLVRLATIEQNISNESIQIDIDNVTVDGKGHTSTGPGTGNGILCSGRNNVIIKNFKITGFVFGISFISKNINNTITNNTIIDNHDGILYDDNNYYNQIVGNTIIDNYYGIEFGDFNLNNRIVGNSINDNRKPIHFSQNNNSNHIANNTISDNMENGISLGDKNNYNDIVYNWISNNSYSGIVFFSNNDNNHIAHNTISVNNQSGIYFQQENDVNHIAYNCILDNLKGSQIDVNNNDNLFECNNFINSTTGDNAYNDGDNFFNSNYWDNRSGSGPYIITPKGQDDNPSSLSWDDTPPTISCSGTLGKNDWYICDVEVTLKAEDIQPCSMNDYKIQYSFNGTDWEEYTKPLTISTEGITTVYYYSENNYGEDRKIKTKEVKIDKSPPQININIPKEGSVYRFNETILADWVASDHYSGVACDLGVVNSGDSINTSCVGENTFTVKAIDNAGNSTSQTITYYVKSNTPGRGFKLI